MRIKNIDEIIKKSFKESERQNNLFVNRSKSRVWNAIERPKKQKSLHWGFVTAMAASVSLFLISVFLLLKLDSKHKEIDAMHDHITRRMPLNESPADNPFTNETATTRWDIKSDELPGPMPTDKKAQVATLVQYPKLPAVATEKSINSEAAPLPLIEKKIMDAKPEMTFPEFGPPELKEELVLSGTSDYKIPSPTKSKKHGKLKIRFGNGSSAYSHDHSHALNLKL